MRHAATDTHATATATATTMPTASTSCCHVHASARRIGLVAGIAIAALAAGGCGPSRTTPDVSLRAAPKTMEPTATIRIAVEAERMSPDSAGTAVGSFAVALVPLVSAVSPSFGADGLAAGAVVGAITDEVKQTKAAKVVTAGDADYTLEGSAESRHQMRHHMFALGCGYYLALLPVAFGVPNKSYATEAEADLVLRRRDGQKLWSRSYDRSQAWWTGPYVDGNAYNQPLNVIALNRDVNAREVGMLVARDVAAAIERDQAAAKP